MPDRVNVYVDGFNLYYQRVKGTPYKWLDLRLLAENLLPGAAIRWVRYFTTWVQPRPHDPQQQQRQQAYIRALRTTKDFSVEFGLFRERKKHLRAVYPPPDMVWVYKTEEKGSDVNLASYLLLDAFHDEYDAALVISNDADLKTPIEIVRNEFRKPVTIGIPGTAKQFRTSALPGDKYVRIEAKQHLRTSQLPETLQDADGTIRKPAGW